MTEVASEEALETSGNGSHSCGTREKKADAGWGHSCEMGAPDGCGVRGVLKCAPKWLTLRAHGWNARAPGAYSGLTRLAAERIYPLKPACPSPGHDRHCPTTALTNAFPRPHWPAGSLWVWAG